MAAETPLVKVAVFGAGRMGREHIKNLLQEKNVGIAYVVTRTKESLKSVKEDFPLLEYNTRCSCEFLVATEEDKVFADKDVKGVVIATSNPEHENQIIKSIKSGKAVFCEKPLAPSFPAINSILAMAEKGLVPILLGFQRRFDPCFNSARCKVQTGEIGKIHLIKICSRDPELPSPAYQKLSAGLVHDSTVHDLDMACWIANEYPTEIYGIGVANYESVKAAGDIDTLVVTLKFPSGALAVIDQSRAASYGYDQRLEVFGDKGMVNVANHIESSTVFAQAKGFLNPCPRQNFLDRYGSAYQNEIQHFVEIIQGAVKPFTPSEAILKNGYLAEILVQSLNSGKPIPLEYGNVSYSTS